TGPTEPAYTAGFRCVLALEATAPAPPIQNPQPAQAALPIPAPSGMARALFNGRDLTGWHIRYASRHRRNAWKVENGELKNDVFAGEGGADLESDEKFWNFNLHYEYKVARDSRTSISMRSIHWLKIHGDFVTGQLSEASDGAIGGRKAPDVYASDRSGGWNTADVTMYEQSLSVTLNGKKIHDAVDVSALPRGFTAEAWSPGRAGPITLNGWTAWVGEASSVRISAQVSFRNITVQTLPGEPKPVVAPGIFTTIFNGKDLTGWDGDPKYWSVREGAITAESPPNGRVPRNTFLIWKDGTLTDFELRLSYKITAGNSGIQYRSRVSDPAAWVVLGYQYEMDATKRDTNGALYEEGGQRKGLGGNPGGLMMANVGEKVRMTPDDQKQILGALKGAQFHAGTWNDLVITARGNHITHQLNGVTTIDVTDEDARASAASGVLALQLHGGSPQKVQFKDIRLKPLPKAP
ncbi:MAG: DUF1080 domain-containing protein, partial [Chthoniobacteraceae bacterium]